MVGAGPDEDGKDIGGAALDGMLRIVTESGSTYMVGPGEGAGIRVERLSDHAVRGAGGPRSFGDEYVRVGLVSNGSALILECTAADGSAFRTSPIREVASPVLASTVGSEEQPAF